MVSPENTTLPSCSFCSGLVEDEEEEEEGERNRQREGQPFRLEDTSSLSWKRRHWRNGSLGRTASRWFRESSTCKESKTERQTEREMEREIERGERERALRAQPFLVSVRLSLSLSLPLSSSYPLDRSSSLAVVTPQTRLSFFLSLFYTVSLALSLSRPLSVPSSWPFLLFLSDFPKPVRLTACEVTTQWKRDCHEEKWN